MRRASVTVRATIMGGCVVLVLTGWGAFLRLWNINQRPFWTDEAWVAQAVTHQSFARLLVQKELPLPPLFAVAAKLCGHLVSPPELGLRLVPALCGIACVPLSVFLLRTLRVPWSVSLAAASLVASSYLLVCWSRELKQYEVEAFCCLLLALAVLRVQYGRPGRRRWPASAGAIAICAVGPWLGYGTVFPAAVLAGIPVVLRPHTAPRRAAVLTGLAALAALAISTGTLLHLAAGAQASHPALVAFTSAWFIDPLDLQSWLRAAFHACVCISILLFPWEWVELSARFDTFVYAALTALGIGAVALVGLGAWPGRGRREMFCWTFGPWLLAMAAGVAHRYPFAQPRMTVVLALPMILALGSGLVRIGRELAVALSGRGHAGIRIALLLTILPAGYMVNVPLRRAYCADMDFPKLIRALDRHRSPGELVVVSHLAAPCVRYYIGPEADPVLYLPNEAGSLAPLNCDYNVLLAETGRLDRKRWWLLCTSSGRPKAPPDVLLQWAVRQGYQLELLAIGGDPTGADVPQLYQVIRRTAR